MAIFPEINEKELIERLEKAQLEISKALIMQIKKWIDDNEFELSGPLMNSKYVDSNEFKKALGVKDEL